jgi:hypothetical protein
VRLSLTVRSLGETGRRATKREIRRDFTPSSSPLHVRFTILRHPRRPTIHPTMKRSTALLLQVVIGLIGIGVLAFLLGEPHLEGRNAHATTFEIYFKDPFLAYVYVGSIPFFVALYRAFGLLGQVRQHRAFSQASVDALRVIKRCAITIIGFVAGAVVFIIMFGDPEDRPPGISMSLLVMLLSSLVAIAAARIARNLQGALRRSHGSHA